MIDATQIAHDLAVAKLAGKDLPVKALVAEYRSAYSDIMDYLKSETSGDKSEAIQFPTP